MKEGTLVKKMKDYIKDRGGYVENIWGGGFQAAGIPDLVGCYRGYFIGIEVKVGRNTPSEIQKAKIQMINDAGGYGIIVWDSLDDVIALLERIDERVETGE